MNLVLPGLLLKGACHSRNKSTGLRTGIDVLKQFQRKTCLLHVFRSAILSFDGDPHIFFSDTELIFQGHLALQ